MQKQPPQVFYKKGVFKNFAKFTAKQLCRSFFFDKISGIKPPTLLKRRLRRGCFSMNFARFLSTSFVWSPPPPPQTAATASGVTEFIQKTDRSSI